MASENVIQVLLQMVGAELAKRQIDDVAQSGENMLQTFNKSTSPAGEGITQTFINMEAGAKKATGAATEHTRSINLLTQAYHLLHPAAALAGQSLGETGVALRALGRLGIGGTGFVLGAAVVAGLGSLADKLKVIRERLRALQTSEGQGDDIFAGLRKSAEETNTRFGDLATGIESFQNKFQKGAFVTQWGIDPATGQRVVQSIGQIDVTMTQAAEAATTLSKAFQVDRFTAEDSAKAVNNLLQAVGKLETVDISKDPFGGWTKAFGRQGLTQEILAQIQQQAPRLATLLDETLRGPFQTLSQRLEEEGPLAAGKFFEGLKTIQPQIDNLFSQMVPTQGQALNAAKNQAFNTFDEFAGKADAVGQEVINIFQRTYNNIKNIFSTPIPIEATVHVSGSGLSDTNIPPFASGGQIFGPGSATSDSILARLSNREYVQPVRSVDYYGVRFMEAIRTLRFPRELAMGSGPAFIPKVPRFAEGGQVNSNLRPFVMNVPGLGSFTGSIAAPDRVVDALSRRSVLEQSAAGGKAPIWRR